MSPITQTAVAVLPTILNFTNIPKIISGLPGGNNGPAVANFTDSNANVLPLNGSSKIGVHIFSVIDSARHSNPFCDFGGAETSDALCSHLREIRVSMFYPACPHQPDGIFPPVLQGEQYFAPVFEPSLVAKISQLTLGVPTAMHNVMSQAAKDAPLCNGEYSLVMFTPAANGQRQAYTQAASKLASLGYIAIAVDHPYVSGLVQLSDNTTQAGIFNHSTKSLVAEVTQLRDILFLRDYLTHEGGINRPPISEQADVSSKFCVFGHGTGGEVAQTLVEHKVAACGGRLEGTLRLPYPLDTQDGVEPPDEDSLEDWPGIPVPPRVAELADYIIKKIRKIISDIACRVTGNCSADTERRAIQKRRIGVDNCCYDRESCNEGGCGSDWEFRDDGRSCDEECDRPCEGDCDSKEPHHDNPPPDHPNLPPDRPCEGDCDDEEPHHDNPPPDHPNPPPDRPCEGDCDDEEPHHDNPPPDHPNSPPDRPCEGDCDSKEPHHDNPPPDRPCEGDCDGKERHHGSLPPDHSNPPSDRPWDWEGDWECSPESPCDDDRGPWDNDCEQPHGMIHEHYNTRHGVVHGHYSGWDGYTGDDGCEDCYGPVGSHHLGWDRADEGYKWNDHDYDFEDDDEDDEDEDHDNGDEEDEDEDEDDDEDEDEDEDEDDEGEDDEEDEDDCGDEGSCQMDGE